MVLEYLRRVYVLQILQYTSLSVHQEMAHQMFIDQWSPLYPTEREWFAYPWIRDEEYSSKLGKTVSPVEVRLLVPTAILKEVQSTLDASWREEVHGPLLRMALRTSKHSETLALCISVSKLNSINLNPVFLRECRTNVLSSILKDDCRDRSEKSGTSRQKPFASH